MIGGVNLGSRGGSGGGGGGSTDLGYTAAASQGTVTSSTGTSAVLPLATGGNAGLLTAAERAVVTAAVATPAQGDVLYYNGTAWARLAAGTSGFFLKTNGAGANPSWAAATAAGSLLAANNLSDVASAATSRTNLGLVAIASSGSASDLSAGTVPTARLGSGTADSTTFLRGDQTWATPGGGGVALGRPKTGATAAAMIPGAVWTSAVASATMTQDRLWYEPIIVDSTITVTGAVAEVTVASGVGGSAVRAAIYNADTDWQPTTLVIDMGTLATDSIGSKSITGLSQSLSPGRYLLMRHSSSGTAQLRCVRANLPGVFINSTFSAAPNVVWLYKSGVAYAAAPATGVAWDSFAYDATVGFERVSALTVTP